MSSSHKAGRVIRAARSEDDVFVLGETVRSVPAPAAIATATEVLAAAERQAADILALARSEADTLVANAQAEAATIETTARETGYREGFAAGRQAALAELEQCLALARQAASEGKAIRDSVAEQSAAVVARATALATRRIVGEYYEADPERTALACADALRAAAGQEILAIRVHPGVAGSVQATLVDVAAYIRPDESVAIGGCIIDLRHGTLDATLDARLSLMDLALNEAGGEVGR
jgi:flagellar biosynthesis/type III secretory pathway protein FliH